MIIIRNLNNRNVDQGSTIHLTINRRTRTGPYSRRWNSFLYWNFFQSNLLIAVLYYQSFGILIYEQHDLFCKDSECVIVVLLHSHGLCVKPFRQTKKNPRLDRPTDENWTYYEKSPCIRVQVQLACDVRFLNWNSCSFYVENIIISTYKWCSCVKQPYCAVVFLIFLIFLQNRTMHRRKGEDRRMQDRRLLIIFIYWCCINYIGTDEGKLLQCPHKLKLHVRFENLATLWLHNA